MYKLGTNDSDIIDIRKWTAPVSPESSHGVNAAGGDDTVYGSAYYDIIQGGAGNDVLWGYSGDDLLVGKNVNDRLFGGYGNDSLWGGGSDAGKDTLNGGTGNDFLSGGAGNDRYIHDLNSGVDTINDGKSETGRSGYGGGSDTIQFSGISLANLAAYRPDGSNDLWLATIVDLADGKVDDGVIIQDFYLEEVNTFIEFAITSDNYVVDLAQII